MTNHRCSAQIRLFGSTADSPTFQCDLDATHDGPHKPSSNAVITYFEKCRAEERKNLATYNALNDVGDERKRQEDLRAQGKFLYSCATPNGLSNPEKLAVLAEEFGEVAKEVTEEIIIETRIGAQRARLAEQLPVIHKNLRKELIQVAAVCVAWIEAMDAEAVEK